MPDKSRGPRKSEGYGFMPSPVRQLSKKPERFLEKSKGTEEQKLEMDIEDQLTKIRQDLEKAQKTNRSLARDYARAEQEIRRREDCFFLVFQQGSDVIIRLSREGKILEISPSCQALLNASPQFLQGRSLQELVAKEDQDPLRRFLHNVLKGSETLSFVIHFLRQNQIPCVLNLHCRAVPHPQTQQLEILGIASPFSPATQPQPSSRADLTLQLAHELNQPLTAMAISARACSQLARLNDVDTGELIQAIDQIADQAERAGELVRRMRELAAGSPPRRSLESLEDLAQSAVHMLKADLAKGRISLKWKMLGDMPKLFIDRIQIEQVLVNLIRNAIEAMGDMPMDRRNLTIEAFKKERELVMQIADTGPGLPPELAQRLFKPYQSTKTNGMGLGLAVSHAIIQAHAGRLWVEPRDESGTTFCFALPLPSEDHE
jgi:PAS domain S-box-containing protein